MEDIGNYGYTLFRTIPFFNFINVKALVPGDLIHFKEKTR